MENEAARADLDDLDYDYDDHLTLHEGQPFTGQSIEKDNKGNIVDLGSYKRGIGHGEQKGWHSNGQVKYVGSTKEGIAHGVWNEWHPNGQLSEETEFDDAGNRMYFREWNSKGDLVKDEVFHKRPRPLIDPEANF